MRYVDPTQPGQPSLPTFVDDTGAVMAVSNQDYEAIPLQVTTVNGNQFVCLNLNQENIDPNVTYNTTSDITAAAACYAPLSEGAIYSPQSDTYVAATADLTGINTATYVTANPGNQSLVQSRTLTQPGIIQAPVHSQFVIQRVGTLPRQYAHPLSQ